MDGLIGEAACKGADPLVQLVLLHSVYGSTLLYSYTSHTFTLTFDTMDTMDTMGTFCTFHSELHGNLTK